MDERIFWLGFSLFPGVGPQRFGKLLARFVTAKAAWGANSEDLTEVLGKKLTQQFVAFRDHLSLVEYEKKLAAAQVDYLLLSDEQYPQLLRQINDPPFVLYTKGSFDFNAAENRQTIGIVGTRKVTTYGRQVTALLTRELVAAGCVIVSGLALGVDAIAHKTTLEQKGKTIAVLGCGIDCPYPRENAGLYADILGHDGIVVSEYGLGFEPTKWSFPARNRIIAGLSRAVLVTEGAASSGSLITANDAFANDRKVFAVPGPINSSLSQGPYALIKKGAILVTGVEEIMNELGMRNQELGKRNNVVKGDTKEEQQVIDLLKEEELSFDVLVKKIEISSQQLGILLSVMEMKGMVRSSDNGLFGLSGTK